VCPSSGEGPTFTRFAPQSEPRREADCRRIAELARIASDGGTDYVWSTLAPEHPGLALIEIGAIRYSGEESPLFLQKLRGSRT
jgi:hypothetical protein